MKLLVRHSRAGAKRAVGTFLSILLLNSCSVGPDYTKPDAPTPAAFKELDGWKPSDPRDDVDRGAWWSVYSDATLDDLERQIDISNQTLKQSEAAYRQARAVVDQARASFFPTVTGSGSAQRSYEGPGARSSGVSSFTTGATTATGTGTGTTTVISGVGDRRGGTAFNAFASSLGASWDLDVWGKIRRTVEGDVATAQASAADLASARLSAQATLATDYIELRYQEALKRLLDTTASDFKRSLDITQNQYKVGVAAKADVLSAQTQLLDAQAQAINAGVLRATLEHAIAVLVGKPPGDVSIAPGTLPVTVPVIPVGLPSTLLERRPDIAAAERTMQAANAQIGVAIAGYFPDITLTGSYGSQSAAFSNLFASPASVWSVGGSVAETLIDFGARSAQVEQARATWDQDVASYRQTVLTGFQQVEDELSTLRILQQQAAIEVEVVKSAQEAARLTLNQYKAGTVPYSSVITAQASALSDEETALGVTENRLTASVTLIEAVGGGWDAGKLPRSDQVEDDSSFLHLIPISSDH